MSFAFKLVPKSSPNSSCETWLMTIKLTPKKREKVAEQQPKKYKQNEG